MTLLNPENLHDYQKECLNFLLENKESMLWLQMGLGKTPITLTAIKSLMDAGEVKKTIIFGPLRVIQSVWGREIRKWSHLQGLRTIILHGSLEKRTRLLFEPADIYLCNYEGMSWLSEMLHKYYISKDLPVPFDMVVYDEVSKLKNSSAKRFAGGSKTLKDRWGAKNTVKVYGWKSIIPHIERRAGLTGTPASNGYLDLFGQYYAVDAGQRLGKTITHYRNSYFGTINCGQFNKYTVTDLGKEIIEQKISDITIKMDAKDYLDMPEIVYHDLFVDLPSKARDKYAEIEKDFFTQLDSGEEIELANTLSLYNKCLQFANGTPYIGEIGNQTDYDLHDAKIEALEDVIEEAGGQPVLCSYSYKSDARRIMKHFKSLKPVNISDVASSKLSGIIDKWNRGEIKLLLGHPASMGHGIDGLQDSGNILVWFGLPWSLELYEQMVGRLNRQGQKKAVSVISILCRNTIDLVVREALVSKVQDQDGLKDAIQAYRQGRITEEYEW